MWTCVVQTGTVSVTKTIDQVLRRGTSRFNSILIEGATI